MDSPFATHPECPSELRLDRLHLGELGADEAAAVNAHVAQCARCKDRVALRGRGHAAFDLDSSKMLDRIEAKLGAASPSPPPSKKKPVLPIAISAALAIALVAVLYPRSQPEDVIRAKGGLELTVYRQREGKVSVVVSGESLRPKDRLRFMARVPEDADEIMIVSVEEGGKLFAYYPSDGTVRSRRPITTDDGALEGAIELDESRAAEDIHLVACAKPFALADLKPGERPHQLTTPRGCERVSIVVVKEGAP